MSEELHSGAMEKCLVMTYFCGRPRYFAALKRCSNEYIKGKSVDSILSECNCQGLLKDEFAFNISGFFAVY